MDFIGSIDVTRIRIVPLLMQPLPLVSSWGFAVQKATMLPVVNYGQDFLVNFLPTAGGRIVRVGNKRE